MTVLLFPVLYTFTKTGKKQFWSIFVEDKNQYSVIVIKYGLVDGKVTTNEKRIDIGKNIGKTNETSHYKQAINEAEYKWKTKICQNYKEDTNEDNKLKNEIILPMLAMEFKERGKDILFPCYVQPKLDGVRAIYNKKNGVIHSRTGKTFPNLNHIIDEIQDSELILDGELYSNTLGFQDIVGIVRKKKLNDKDLIKIKEIHFYVYDTVLEDDYSTRLMKLQTFFNNNKYKYTKLVITEKCNSIEEVPLFHSKYVEQGYEGLILRNFKGRYEIKNRSMNLQKFKEFKDDEFEIVSYTEGTGIEKGLVIWICKTKENKLFNVRPKGTHEERKKLYADGYKYIGKYLTVKYFEYTDDNIPRFPIGISIRDYE